MKFGVHYQSYSGTEPVRWYRETLEEAVHAEALGFESIWPVEQHFIADRCRHVVSCNASAGAGWFTA